MSYTCLRDQNNRIIGLWVPNRADAENGITLATWLTMSGANNLAEAALKGETKITPNNVNNQGGYFVFVGEAARMVATPSSAPHKAIGQESGQPKWWQFWKW